jgi:hypothetical protein
MNTQSDLIKKVIEITDIIEKRYETGKQAKLKDTSNLTYNVYEKKQDGSTSAAWSALDKVTIGDTIEIAYVEQEKEYEGKPYTARTIRIINTDIGNGVKNHQSNNTTSSAQTPRNVANTGSQSKGNDAFGKRLAVHGFVNALISSGTKPNDITGEIIVELTKLESRIDTILNPSAFRQAVQAHAPQVVEPELPTIQVADDIQEYANQIESEVNVDDIPF